MSKSEDKAKCLGIDLDEYNLKSTVLSVQCPIYAESGADTSILQREINKWLKENEDQFIVKISTSGTVIYGDYLNVVVVIIHKKAFLTEHISPIKDFEEE